ncbi:MAG TPA: regulatory signaling modulator protein AmpE [Marinagarivorans sp.]
MLLLSLLFAVALKQFWEPSNPLHRDGWIANLELKLRVWLPKVGIDQPVAVFGTALVLLVASIALVDHFLHNEAKWLQLIFATAILLYSFGRGEFNQYVTQFIVAEAKRDWSKALETARKIGCDTHDIAENDWQALNKRFLSKASYLGFERFFAVIFWFVIFGPAGAFAYRLSHLWQQRSPHAAIAHWLWVIEWPAVRVLGLSYCITGNFGSCINRWKNSLLSNTMTSEALVFDNMLGALSVDDSIAQTPEVTRRELEAIQQLQSRTLWCWLGIIGILFIA